MEMTEKESAIRRIQKALALASNNPSAQEAQTALLKAQELMIKHNISVGEVDKDKAPEKKSMEGFTSEDYGKLEWWQQDLAQVIADNFRCYVYWYWGKTSTNRKEYKMCFFGLDQDVEICLELYKFAELSLQYYSQQYVTKQRIKIAAQKRVIKNDFMKGFIKGLEDKFKEQVKQNNWGLVLVKDALVEDEYKGKKVTEDKIRNINLSYDPNALIAGYKRGKSLEKNRTALPESKSEDSRYESFKKFEDKNVRMVANSEVYRNFKVTVVYDKNIKGVDSEGNTHVFWFYEISHIEEWEQVVS